VFVPFSRMAGGAKKTTLARSAYLGKWHCSAWASVATDWPDARAGASAASMAARAAARENGAQRFMV